MAEAGYAFIRGGDVVNIAVFDDPSDELLAHFRTELLLNEIIPATDKAVIGGTWDGQRFWPIQPYPSWFKDYGSTKWVAPMPIPTDGKDYAWDEPTFSWKEVTTNG
jgi:hypothetical protein